MVKKKTKTKVKKENLGGKSKETAREKMIGQHIGYRYDVNLLPDYKKMTPFLKKYVEAMGWDDLNWLEDIHMGYEEDRPAVFCRNANGWVTIPKSIKLPNNQQDRDMIARELLVKFQMSKKHPLVDLKKAYLKVLVPQSKVDYFLKLIAITCLFKQCIVCHASINFIVFLKLIRREIMD